MMSTIEAVRPQILKVLRRHDVARAGIFGSYARSEQKKSSDIDLLVEVPKDVNLLGFVGIKHELEDATGRRVDLVEYGCIKPLLRESILAEEVRIL